MARPYRSDASYQICFDTMMYFWSGNRFCEMLMDGLPDIGTHFIMLLAKYPSTTGEKCRDKVGIHEQDVFDGKIHI